MKFQPGWPGWNFGPGWNSPCNQALNVWKKKRDSQLTNEMSIIIFFIIFFNFIFINYKRINHYTILYYTILYYTILYYTIIKLMRALWLVNHLWFIVPVNPWKFRVSSELLYRSNRPQVFMVYSLINHLWCWKNTRRIRKSLPCGSWFTNSSRVLQTSRVVYQAINHRNLWSIA